MSRRPIALSPDLLRLQNEGYDIRVRSGCLVVGNIPYVTAARTIARGALISKLKLSADKTDKPDDHVAYWRGEHPCHSDGQKLAAFENNSTPPDLGDANPANFTFSAKADYRDYHHKVTTYVGRIAGEAAKIDPSVTAMEFLPIPAEDEDSVFNYVDTASSRAGIAGVNNKVAGLRIGVIGTGGSGAYVVDLVAKTPVAEIHLFDGDVFSQHNAFRCPGAPTIEQLASKPQKAAYLASIYTNMRKGVIVHDAFIDAANVSQLAGLDFVFLCMDGGEAKRIAVDYLVAQRIPFIEVGMGVLLDEEQLRGIVRVTMSTPETHPVAAAHISYSSDDGGANEYATNIQIAELNALNAAMAVIRWKKHYGIYADTRRDVYWGYSIASGEIVPEGAA